LHPPARDTVRSWVRPAGAGREATEERGCYS
jgi:hypothetical protein